MHRFSNAKRVRDAMYPPHVPYTRWDSIPTPLRHLMLETIQQAIDEVLAEGRVERKRPRSHGVFNHILDVTYSEIRKRPEAFSTGTKV